MPIPILLLVESIDRMGIEDIVVAYVYALIAEGKVVVAELVKASCPTL